MGSLGNALRKAFSPYLGRAAVDTYQEQPIEKEIICLFTRIGEFESVAGRNTLRHLRQLIDRY